MGYNADTMGVGSVGGSLANVMAEFDAAASYLGLCEDEVAFIREPRCSITLRLPVRQDDGRIKVFKGFHTIHSIMRGPSIGGVQFRPDVSLETVEALAFWSTHRCALLGIPFGGNSGAVICDPATFSVGELERISRRYIADLSRFVSPNNDILVSDIGTNQQVMCWFMDTYSSHMGANTPDVVLGKPVDLGGMKMSVHSAAIGVELCISRACEAKGVSLSNAKVAIQGFGKVGMNVAKLLAARGAKVVGIADISGAYVNEGGISVEHVIWHQQSYGILDGLEAEVDVHKLSDPDELFGLPADILILAAVELQVVEENVGNVRAGIVAEVAHDPVSPEADRYLNEKGVLVIPDVLCSAGGIAGYYLEWVQNRQGYYWQEDRIKEEIGNLIGAAFDGAMKVSKDNGLSLRQASAVLAVKRVAGSASLRGIYA